MLKFKLSFLFACLAVFGLTNASLLPNSNKPTTQNPTCNCRTRQASNRIVGGEIVNDPTTVYPWMVSIGNSYYKELTEDAKKKSHFCGGTLISPSYVMTAAHCVTYFYGEALAVKEAENMEVRFGADLVQAFEKAIPVANIILPNKYSLKDARRFNNDIAILKLQTPVTSLPNNTASPACLSGSVGPFTDKLIALGYGSITRKFKQPGASEFVTEKPEPEDYRYPLKSLNAVQDEDLPPLMKENKMIKIKSKVSNENSSIQSICSGDSGSSLNELTSGYSRVVGIASVTPVDNVNGVKIECDSDSYYTNVARYLDFIQSNVDEDLCILN